MFQKKKNVTSVRGRQPKGMINETFRRNNVVVSRRQQEIAKRNQSVTQRQLEKKRQLHQQKIRVRVVVVATVVAVGLLLYLNTVKSVQLESNASSRLNSAEKILYENSILEIYKNSALLGQPWLADEETVLEKIKNQYPEIERVNFSSSPLSQRLLADIRFRKAVFTWRDASGEQQFVDGEGRLFSKNLDPSVNVKKLIAIEDQSGVVLEAGSSVLAKGLVEFIGQLHSKLPEVYGKESRVGRVIIPRSTREVQVQIEGQPYLIKFNSTRPVQDQIGELRTLQSYLQANNIVPAVYVDIRVAHKAFYK